jgi:hypothetical protein
VDGERVRRYTDLTDRLNVHAVGDRVTLTVYRVPGILNLTFRDAIPAGETLALTATLGSTEQD